jgi:hypothetical protein
MHNDLFTCNKFSVFWRSKNMGLYILEITYSGVDAINSVADLVLIVFLCRVD